MFSPEHSHTSTSGKWITIAIWAAGIILQLARPWLCTLFALNIENFMVSIVAPMWSFMLVCLLAGLLRVFRKPAEKIGSLWRAVFALDFAVVLMLPQADLIMVFRESWRFPHYIDPMRYILLWAVPLTFYAVPAAVVVVSWLQHNRLVSIMRALGLALVIIGVVYVPFGLWLNQLQLMYTQP
jgi:hypothetical protein